SFRAKELNFSGLHVFHIIQMPSVDLTLKRWRFREASVSALLSWMSTFSKHPFSIAAYPSHLHLSTKLIPIEPSTSCPDLRFLQKELSQTQNRASDMPSVMLYCNASRNNSEDHTPSRKIPVIPAGVKFPEGSSGFGEETWGAWYSSDEIRGRIDAIERRLA